MFPIQPSRITSQLQNSSGRKRLFFLINYKQELMALPMKVGKTNVSHACKPFDKLFPVNASMLLPVTFLF